MTAAVRYFRPCGPECGPEPCAEACVDDPHECYDAECREAPWHPGECVRVTDGPDGSRDA